jgi:hypothetical protein
MRVRRPSAPTIAVAAVVAALAAPCLWAVFAHHTFAVGDLALIELRTRDVLSAHPPLVGAYSRYGWSHPGPLEFYLFALPYRLLGGDFAALRLTALLFNLFTIAAIAWVARRRGVTALVLLMAVAAALVWGLSANALTDSWNVTIAVLPFLLTIVACWCACCGDRWGWLVAAVAFSFVFQAHVGFGVVLAPLVLATAAWLSVGARHDRPDVTFGDVAVGVVAALGLALPTLIDVVAHWPGNLERLLAWSFDNDEPTIGASQSLRLLGRSTSLSFPFHPAFPNQFVFSIGRVDTGFLPGTLLVLLVIAVALTVRRQMAAEASLCACLVVVWISGFVAAGRVTQPLAFWLVEWLQPLAWLTWGAVMFVTWRLLQPATVDRFGRARLRQAGSLIAAVGLVVGTVGYAHKGVSADEHDATTAPIEAFVTAAEHLDRSQPIHIDYGGDPFSAGTIFLAVADELNKFGFDLCVDSAYANQFGDARVCSGRSDLALFIRNEPTALAPPDNSVTLGISDPLSPAQRQEADELTAQLDAVLQENDLSNDEPLLYTQLVELILDHLPPADAAAVKVDVIRLGELRRVPGTRLGFYAIGATQG